MSTVSSDGAGSPPPRDPADFGALGPALTPVSAYNDPSYAGYGPQTPPRNGLGTAALVLGIIAVLMCWTVAGGIVAGVAAFGLGLAGRKRVRRDLATNGRSAIAGIVLGLFGFVLSALLVAIGLSLLHSPSGKTLVQCIKTANGNQSAINACDQQYSSNR